MSTEIVELSCGVIDEGTVEELMKDPGLIAHGKYVTRCDYPKCDGARDYILRFENLPVYLCNTHYEQFLAKHKESLR